MTTRQIDLVIGLLNRTIEGNKPLIEDEKHLSDIVRNSIQDESEACAKVVELLEQIKK